MGNGDMCRESKGDSLSFSRSTLGCQFQQYRGTMDLKYQVVMLCFNLVFDKPNRYLDFPRTDGHSYTLN